MTKLCVFIAFLLLVSPLAAQFYDNFSDGDYTSSPEWVAGTNDFFINSDNQLQSSNTTVNSTFQIFTGSQLAQNAQWEFWIGLDFNTSSVNYADVWLISKENNLISNTNEGYFVRIGTTADNISLYKKTGSQNAVAMIAGKEGILNASSSTLKIKVIRTPDNRWILLRDMTGTGNAYRSEGIATDHSINQSAFFGISIRQSTASFFGKHFFDDFEVKISDPLPTEFNIQSVQVINATELQLTFDNPVNIPSAEEAFHYHVTTLGTPQKAEVDNINGSLVTLTFNDKIISNTQYSILIDEVADIYGNTILGASENFTLFMPSIYDVVINEVFADPSPQIGLPAQKFIELRNNAAFAVNLKDWQIRSGASTATLPAVNISPGGFLIVTSISGRDAYEVYGPVISVAGFPTLNIGGSELALYNAGGALMHAMQYDLTTYKNEVKKDGGFSLELINPFFGCELKGNWMASNSDIGGTPGRENSVFRQEAIPRNISVLDAYLSAPDTVIVKLNKPVDSLTAGQSATLLITPQLPTTKIEAIPPYFEDIKIALGKSVDENTLYSIAITGLTDCAGNVMGARNTVIFGSFKEPIPGDIVINEILSNPKTPGGEYIELYNNGQHPIDISRLYLSNRNSAGEIASVTRIVDAPQSLLPGNFLLLTKDKQLLIIDYPLANEASVLQMSTMPSYPNDKGFVVLLNQQGDILDEVNYEKNWHFQLINETRGIALERIDYDAPANADNFHSAGADAGYGTPGYKNSQYRPGDNLENIAFSITPKIFSPDNDGFDDFLTINYSFEDAGYVTNIKIFDASGRLVRHLEKNSLSGTKGYYRWNGLDEKNQKLPQGIYLIYFESFNEAGKKIIYKKAVTLARRF